MKRIIAITKDKILAVEVSLGNSKFGQTHEFGWKPETLDIVFVEIIKKFKNTSFRILVADDLSYIVRLKVPLDVAKDKERDYIWELIRSEIPEQLVDAQWDYKEVELLDNKKTVGEDKDVIVFALVKSLYDSLSKAIQVTKMNVEAMEPETVAKTRDANALVGLALKEDITGRDEQVLNLKLSMTDRQADDMEGKVNGEELEKIEKSSKKKSIVIMVLVIALLLLLALVAFWLYRNYSLKKDQNKSDLVPSATITAGDEPTAVVEKSAEITAIPTGHTIDLSIYKIQVQNGSGIAGEAGSVKDTLTFEGFKNIDTTNATSSGFTKTDVKMKEGIPVGVYDAVNKALNSDYEITLSGTALDSASNYDLVIIVGERIAS